MLAVPWLPPDMKTFNDAFSLGESFQWDSLEYENACDSSAVKVLIGPMMGDLSTIGFISAPYSSILRFAEGVDSIRNFAKVGDATLTETQRAFAHPDQPHAVMQSSGPESTLRDLEPATFAEQNRVL